MAKEKKGKKKENINEDEVGKKTKNFFQIIRGKGGKQRRKCKQVK